MSIRSETIKEEKEWYEFKEGHSEDARTKLAEKYIPLVKYTVDRIASKFPEHVDKEDLIHDGIIGLLDAIDKFDYKKEIKFETYAFLRIRGAILDEAALIKSLQEDAIRGAALDVFEIEPLPIESPLRSMDNIIMVSHIGTCPEVFPKMRKAGIENVTRFLRGEKPIRIVNPSYILAQNSSPST